MDTKSDTKDKKKADKQTDIKGGKKINLVITGKQYPVWEEQEDISGSSGAPVRESSGNNRNNRNNRNNKNNTFVEREPLVTVQELEASFYQKGGALYWLYEEYLEGHPHPYSTRMKYKGNVLEVVRRRKPSAVDRQPDMQDAGQAPETVRKANNMSSSMVFEAGKSYRTEYATPFGSLLLDIVTRSVELLSEPDEAVELKVCYALENDGRVLGEYELHIKG